MHVIVHHRSAVQPSRRVRQSGELPTRKAAVGEARVDHARKGKELLACHGVAEENDRPACKGASGRTTLGCVAGGQRRSLRVAHQVHYFAHFLETVQATRDGLCVVTAVYVQQAKDSKRQ